MNYSILHVFGIHDLHVAVAVLFEMENQYGVCVHVHVHVDQGYYIYYQFFVSSVKS